MAALMVAVKSAVRLAATAAAMVARAQWAVWVATQAEAVARAGSKCYRLHHKLGTTSSTHNCPACNGRGSGHDVRCCPGLRWDGWTCGAAAATVAAAE